MRESKGIISLLGAGRHGQAYSKLDRAEIYADKSSCGYEDCRLATLILQETSLNVKQDVEIAKARNIYSNN